ncbi:MAG TPA: carboxypeptidase-like regulatory domain-containing protein [Gemmatimonadaceae bacterium]|nr:carboxypeptidase-like regulatory domain-containing protein [Gemmatimonadaceae bacterium]
MSCPRRLLPVLAVLALNACGGAGSDARDAAAGADGPPPPPPYVTIPLEDAGRIEGTVRWEGPLPGDSVVAVGDSLARICGGSSMRLTIVSTAGGGVAGSIVWLADARRGRALSASRRFELATERCRLTPAVQPAIAGGMLNVLSLDRLVHRLQFIRPGTEGTVGRVEQFDAGQVVPLESVLSLPGPVTVRSDRFPWMEAWIHVFDHPYFAMTDRGGTFALDSIPPGRYTLVVWHPSTGQRDTTVVVTAGDTSRLAISIGMGE